MLWVFAVSCNDGESTNDIAAVANFQIDQYLGTWYEIARLPHSFEQGMDYVTASYSKNPDNSVKVINRGKKNGEEKSIEGVAKFAKASDIGELKVSFFRPFYGAYRIIKLSPNYDSAIVTSSNKKYLWILAKTPTLAPELLQAYLEEIKLWGFAVEQLQYPKQNIE